MTSRTCAPLLWALNRREDLIGIILIGCRDMWTGGASSNLARQPPWRLRVDGLGTTRLHPECSPLYLETFWLQWTKTWPLRHLAMKAWNGSCCVRYRLRLLVSGIVWTCFLGHAFGWCSSNLIRTPPDVGGPECPISDFAIPDRGRVARVSQHDRDQPPDEGCSTICRLAGEQGGDSGRLGIGTAVSPPTSVRTALSRTHPIPRVVVAVGARLYLLGWLPPAAWSGDGDTTRVLLDGWGVLAAVTAALPTLAQPSLHGRFAVSDVSGGGRP